MVLQELSLVRDLDLHNSPHLEATQRIAVLVAHTLMQGALEMHSLAEGLPPTLRSLS